MEFDIPTLIGIIFAEATAIAALMQIRESRKQTRLAYMPHIFPRVREPTSKELLIAMNSSTMKEPYPFLLSENIGVGVATDVHLEILDNQNKSLLDKNFEIYAFDPKRTYPFKQINLKINTRLKIKGYYFDTAGTKHNVEIEFEYPPKIIKNKQK
jgi:hypothetical protein